MKSNIKIILAVTCLTLAMLACAAVTGGGGSNTPTAAAPIDTDVPAVPTEFDFDFNVGDVLLVDDFSSAQWGTGTDADSSVEYASEALQMIVFTKNHFTWSTPDDQDYQNVHMEVTVINNDTDSTTAFGLMCNQQAGEDNSFYYFAMTPAGEYAIAKAQAGQIDVFLTNNDEWASSDLIMKNAPSYRVGADCGHGNLTLYVDGQQIASVSDSSYTNGGVAVFTWSGEEVASANVSFDDFAMTELP
jgi:hypothetical protein